MAEYIEREKTVKVLRDLSTRSGGVFGVIICSVAKAIEKIPAADVRPVVLCRDRKWWRGEGTICEGIGIDFDAGGFCCEGERKDGGEAVKKAAETYKAAYIAEHDARVAESQRWIPVTERRPEGRHDVLVYAGVLFPYITVGYYDGLWKFSFDDSEIAGGVDYWMPLPQPPKEETNG
jgi:hypothetical protein